MKAYLIIFAIVFSITVISSCVSVIAEREDPNSLTFELSMVLANVFGIVSVFMLFGGLLCIFC